MADASDVDGSSEEDSGAMLSKKSRKKKRKARSNVITLKARQQS